MTNGHDRQKISFPLKQTVFLPKDAMGVRKIEGFSSKLFFDDLLFHEGRIWLSGSYTLHLDYRGLEGQKLYKTRVSLPLKLELPQDWQQTEPTQVRPELRAEELEVLSPYVLEFSGNMTVADCEEKTPAAESIISESLLLSEAEASSSYQPDPEVRRVLSEYGAAESVAAMTSSSASEEESAPAFSEAEATRHAVSEIAVQTGTEKEADANFADIKELEEPSDSKSEVTETSSAMCFDQISADAVAATEKPSVNPVSAETKESTLADLGTLKNHALLKLWKRDHKTEKKHRSPLNPQPDEPVPVSAESGSEKTIAEDSSEKNVVVQTAEVMKEIDTAAVARKVSSISDNSENDLISADVEKEIAENLLPVTAEAASLPKTEIQRYPDLEQVSAEFSQRLAAEAVTDETAPAEAELASEEQSVAIFSDDSSVTPAGVTIHFAMTERETLWEEGYFNMRYEQVADGGNGRWQKTE